MTDRDRDPAAASHPPLLPRPGGGAGTVAVLVAGAVGLLALLVVVAALAVVVLRTEPAAPGANPGLAVEPVAAGDPAEPVEDFLDRAADDECTAAGRLVTDALTDPCATRVWRRMSRGDVEPVLGVATVEGDEGRQARVSAALRTERRTFHATFRLDLVDDEWLVSAIDPGTAATPTEVLAAFFDAVFDGDCDLAETYVTEAYLDSQGMCMAAHFTEEELAEIEYRFGSERLEDERSASVSATLVTGDDTSVGEWSLVRQQREWRVDRLPE